MFATALALGASVGLTLALTGAGGGIMAVPLLVFALHLDVARAAPVGLLAVGLAAALGAAAGLREGKVRYRAALLIGFAGMVTAPLGVALAQHVPTAPLTVGFALVLGWSAVRMIARSLGWASRWVSRQPAPNLPCLLSPNTGRLIWTQPCARALASTGLKSGLLSGLLGVGGGFVIVPALTRYSNLSADAVVSTSLAVIALVSISGVTTAAAHGVIDWATALPFALGASCSLLAGRRLATRWSGPVLQRSFAALSLVVSVLLLWRGLVALTN